MNDVDPFYCPPLLAVFAGSFTTGRNLTIADMSYHFGTARATGLLLSMMFVRVFAA